MTTLIYISQIALTKPIIDAIENAGGTVPANSPKPNFIPAGHTLSRMDSMMELPIDDFDTLLVREPITVTPLKRTIDGPPLGRMINNMYLPLYDVLNGRHRLARAIVEGKTRIPVTIVP